MIFLGYKTYEKLAERLCLSFSEIRSIAESIYNKGIYTREEIHLKIIDLVDELNIIEKRPKFTIGEVRDAIYKNIQSEQSADIFYLKYLQRKYGIGDGKI